MTYLRWGLIAGMLLLTGCTSLPSPSETSGGYMVMPIEVTADAPGNFFYDYEFKIYDTRTDEELGRFSVNVTSSTQFELSKRMEPGFYYLGTMISRSRNSGQLTRRSSGPLQTYVPFVIEEDSITMVPSYLSVHRYPKDGSIFTRYRLYDITPQMQAETLSALQQNETIQLWNIIPPLPVDK